MSRADAFRLLVSPVGQPPLTTGELDRVLESLRALYSGEAHLRP